MKTLKEILMCADPVSVLREMDATGRLVDLDPNLAGLRMKMLPGAHHKDNLDHSIRVLGNAIARESMPDMTLRTAALLHDIGKPSTRKIAGRNNVSFDGHETVGAAIARKMLKNHGYAKNEIADICELIALHMRSHGFEENGVWTDAGLRRLINDVSNEEQMQRLIIIFYADVTTKNDGKRAAIHRQVAKLVAEMDRVKREDARSALRPALNGHEVMEILGITPGKELGVVMKFLNSDEGIALSREKAIRKIMSDHQ